jgi:hypothetical protein
VIYQEAMGIPGVTMPPDPIQTQPTYASAKAAFEQLKPIRVLFDNGAGGTQPGQPQPAFEQSFTKFPVPNTTPRFWYFTNGGGLSGSRPPQAGADSFTWNAHARPLTDFSGDTGSGTNGLWTATPPYHWAKPPAGSAASYVSKPFTQNTTVIGAGAVHAWVRSSTPNVDLQATVTEIRPDGKETFVQNGWVRANERKLDASKSTLLEPVLSLRASDVSPMPKGRYVKVTIPLYYQGHAYRAGSRLRVVLTAPNGDQPIWSFGETLPKGHANVSIAHSKSMPSSIILPVVPNVSVPTGLPPCPGLRGEPCRNYQPYVNQPTP